MRSHEERVTETKRRIAKIEQEKRLRRNTITMASAVAACLVLLIGASLAIYARYGQSNGAGHVLRLWNSGNNAGRQCCAWIYRDRTARLCPWCVCDNCVLPYLPAA